MVILQFTYQQSVRNNILFRLHYNLLLGIFFPRFSSVIHAPMLNYLQYIFADKEITLIKYARTTTGILCYWLKETLTKESMLLTFIFINLVLFYITLFVFYLVDFTFCDNVNQMAYLTDGY